MVVIGDPRWTTKGQRTVDPPEVGVGGSKEEILRLPSDESKKNGRF